MALEDLRLRNTQQLVDEVASRVPLVAEPDDYSLSRLLYEEMQTLPIPSRDPDRPTIVVTIIARRGFNVWTRTEMTWAMAWRYSNHLTGAFGGDTVVVTEHGWASLDTHAAGLQPSLVAAS